MKKKLLKKKEYKIPETILKNNKTIRSFITDFFFFCGYTPRHVGLSSPTRDGSLTPALEAWSLNHHWTIREVPHYQILKFILNLQ